MADQELSPAEIEALKKGTDSSTLDSDREESVSEGREARGSADADTKAALIRGKALFTTSTEEGRVSSTVFDLSELAGGINTKLNAKAIDADLRHSAVTVTEADETITYYISASSREVCMRSMEKQGIKINKTDLTSVAGARGARTRFNSFDNRHPKYYASGSHKIDGGGPRIQGPSGGPGSCKFVIIQR